MKVLWFTNIPMPAMDRRAGRATQGSGTWMLALLESLTGRTDLELGIATAYPGREDLSFRQDGIEYHVIGQSRACWRKDFERAHLDRCVQLAAEFEPNLIHIHGTERFYGLIAPRVACPTVISIQGLVNPLAEWRSFFGRLSPWQIVRAHRTREWLRGGGLLRDYVHFRRRASQERAVIARNRNYLGRTDWDRAQLLQFNPRARYLTVQEAIRPEFHAREWNRSSCRRYRLISTNAGHPRRGTEVLLEALARLRSEFPSAELALAGAVGPQSGYRRFLDRRITELGLKSAVQFLGHLDAATMADELARSHVYVIPSYLENSPNSLCEAMLMGLPCVASFTGGIPSLLSHGEDGLFFPTGDAVWLAEQIRTLLRNDALAQHLGRAARVRAMERHAPERVTDELIGAYHQVADQAEEVCA